MVQLYSQRSVLADLYYSSQNTRRLVLDGHKLWNNLDSIVSTFIPQLNTISFWYRFGWPSWAVPKPRECIPRWPGRLSIRGVMHYCQTASFTSCPLSLTSTTIYNWCVDYNMLDKPTVEILFRKTPTGFDVRGESPGCRLFGTASMLEWLRNLLPHHSQGSSTERWSRNTPRVVTARVFYVLFYFK